MLVDFNYPFANLSNSVYYYSIQPNAGIGYYNINSNHERSRVFTCPSSIKLRELRYIELTVDFKTTNTSISTGYYYMVLPYYSSGTSYYSYLSAAATTVTRIDSNSSAPYTMRATFKLYNTNYTNADSYVIPNIYFSCYYGYTESITVNSSTITYMPVENLNILELRLTKNLTQETLSISNTHKTGIQVNASVAGRTATQNTLPVSVLANINGELIAATDVIVNNGQNSNILSSYCKDAMVSSMRVNNIVEDFRLYQFTAFDTNLTIDYPIPSGYTNKPTLKVFSTNTFSTGSYTGLLYSISGDPSRSDSKTLKLDLTLELNKTYYVLVVTGPFSYMSNCPGSLFIYNDRLASYNQKFLSTSTWPNSANTSYNGINMETNKTYNLLDYISDYPITGYRTVFEFTPSNSGNYVLDLSNFKGSSTPYVRIYYYINGSHNNTYGWYTSNGTITFSLTAGNKYSFVVYLRYGYFSQNIDLKLLQYGRSMDYPIDLGSLSSNSTWTYQTNSSSYGSLLYGSRGVKDEYIYFKVYLYSGYTYTFTSTNANNDNYFFLYNSSKSQIGSNDDGNGYPNFKYTYTCTSSGYYYIGISKYTSSATTVDGYCTLTITRTTT